MGWDWDNTNRSEEDKVITSAQHEAGFRRFEKQKIETKQTKQTSPKF